MCAHVKYVAYVHIFWETEYVFPTLVPPAKKFENNRPIHYPSDQPDSDVDRGRSQITSRFRGRMGVEEFATVQTKLFLSLKNL